MSHTDTQSYVGTQRPQPSRSERIRAAATPAAFLRWLIIFMLLCVTVFPFLYMGLLSVRDLSAVIKDPMDILPSLSEINLTTYADVLKSTESGGQGFLGFIRNSGIVAVGTTVLSLVLAIPASYAISRLDFPGREKVSTLFVAVYLFPAVLLAVPLFVFFSGLGLRGELGALLVVYVSQTIAVSVFMLRNYFATIPVSIEEAAAMDGLSRMAILWRISIPLALPSIMSSALFVFMIAWNEFLFALLFLVEDRNTWTVSLGLAQLANSIEVPTTVLMAGSVVLTLPIVIIFFASERWLTGGLTAGADKG